jgi:hypothetical protein
MPTQNSALGLPTGFQISDMMRKREPISRISFSGRHYKVVRNQREDLHGGEECTRTRTEDCLFHNANGGQPMKLQEVREIAKKRGLKIGKMKKTELIRAIQETEGNNDCFDTPYVRECNQFSCLWREDCVKEDSLKAA